ncbi:branched-chain amino acid ABC transporter substrate-binding protein [Amycolatopsis samaneae]|uniref:Branched-chain amino acid ABC transporter substrate-binding protein n=1 Tax=Amycolatopsis samaneae TaxID=664691 RepID=A0ABW5GBW8_9PSEU
MANSRFTRILVPAVAAVAVLGACEARDQGGPGGTTNSSASAPQQAANAADPKGDGKAQCSGATLAYIGTINGDNAALGLNIVYGVDLAVKQHNQANPGCQVALKRFDTEGKPDKAPGVVTQAVSEAAIIGVIGLPFSGESKATGDLLFRAGLVHITPSATNPALAEHSWKTFFRGMGNDIVQGRAAAKFITDKLKANKVCVIEDDSEYGMGLAAQTKQALGAKASCSDKIKTKQTDFSAVVNKVNSEKPDAVFYAGYYNEGAPFAQQLHDKGVTAKFVGTDGVKDQEFVKNAGSAAGSAYFTCPCVPEDNFKDFTDNYKKAEGHDPGTYSAEGYDVATILLKGIDKGAKDRAGLLDFVKNYDGQGLTKKFKWDEKGELSDVPVWSYRVQNGKIVNNGQI